MMGRSEETLKQRLFGRPFASDEEQHQLLPKRLALPVFASDPLSSVAYATEEAMLVLALVHGVNGARIIIGDYVVRGGLRGLLIGLLMAMALVWMLLGLVVILTFDPATAPANIGPFS